MSASSATLESLLPEHGADILLQFSIEDHLNLHSKVNIDNEQSSMRSLQASYQFHACAGQAFWCSSLKTMASWCSAHA